MRPAVPTAAPPAKTAAPAAAERPALPLRVLDQIGAPFRRGAMVAMAAAALAAGVLAEAARPATWRRVTVRAELRRSLRQSLAGGLGTVLVTAAIVGVGMVYQALYWLALVGQEGMTGRILVTVLIREVAPVLVGIVLLGRSGTVTVVEFGEIKANGNLRMLEAQGLDPFQLLVLPRTIAMGTAGFTLGIMFLAMALASGYLVALMLGAVQLTAGEFLSNLLGATGKRDFVLFAVKMTLIGALVALTSAVTGLSSTRYEKPGHLLPRGFVRGVLAVLVTSALLSVAAT
jgi:phospholipid/cholesterol/gamma-HCH transport system permease protein